MPTQYQAVNGFCIMGNGLKPTIEAGERFSMDSEPNKFGPGRKMVTVYDECGDIIGYVTTGQAELIRRGDS